MAYAGRIDTIVETSQEEQRSILIGRDVTEQIESDQKRRSLEWQLQQSQKMEAVGTLAGGIAHDFNNVISVTLGNAELARMKLDVTHPARKNIDTVVAASERARDLVKQILTFSRRQEGKRMPLKVRVVLKEALNLSTSGSPLRLPPSPFLAAASPPEVIDCRLQGAAQKPRSEPLPRLPIYACLAQYSDQKPLLISA